MAEGTWETVKAIGALPVKLYHVGLAAVGIEERDPEGPMSVVGAGRVAGEMASQEEVPAASRFFSVLLLLAGLNLFLGMTNSSATATVRRRWESRPRSTRRPGEGWRGSGNPDPGAVDPARLLPVTYVMAAVILVMSVVLIYADIVAPVSLS